MNATVLVVDDDAAVREALESFLRSVDLDVRTYASAQNFIDAELPDGPVCLVLDVRMPDKSGLELQSELIREGVDLPIIFITGHGDIPMSVSAMKAGAVEFLPKPFRNEDLLAAIRTALEKDRVRRESERAERNLHERYASLSPREREIMVLVSVGLLNKQIANEVHLAEITVKVHRGHMMRKMAARSVADLVRMADRLGLSPDAPRAAEASPEGDA